MTAPRLRFFGVAPLVIAGAGALGVSSALPPATSAFVAGAKTVRAEAALISDESLIMGGSGDPIPSESYVDAINRLYIEPHFPNYTPNVIFTPEGLYPATGIKVLPADTSIAQGQQILDANVLQQVADGNHVVVSGFSQSSTISSLAMTALHDGAAGPGGTASIPVSPADLSFVLTGDPSNPNGGLVERFGDSTLPHLTFPALGQTFTGATPDDLYPTFIYTQEYDGFADFPRYPINLLADLNAIFGIQYVHGTYAELTPEDLSRAITLPTQGDTLSTYYMIPTENLPLLEPLRGIPVVGNPLADLLQPDLKVLVNLGYGDADVGWSTGPANVPTPFGLFGNVDPLTVLHDLATGAQEGFAKLVGDLSDPSSLFASLDPSTVLNSLGAPDLADPPSFTDIVNALSGAAASAYATLLPTADILNTLITTVPAYDVSLFVQELTAGNLLDAIGLPIAAEVGLGSLAAGFELAVIVNAAQEIAADFQGLISS